MKRVISISFPHFKRMALLVLSSITLLTGIAQEAEREYDYIFFENSVLPNYYYFSKVDYTEGSYVKNIRGKLPVSQSEFYTAPNALEINFTNGDGIWEAAVEFERIRGNDFFKKSNHLSFWIKIESAKKEILPVIALCKQLKKKRSDVVLSKEYSKKISISKYITEKRKGGWSFVKIPLSDFGNFSGKPNVIAFSNSNTNGKGKVYVDQLELLPEVQITKTSTPHEIKAKGYEHHVDITWDKVRSEDVKYIQIFRSSDNETFEPIGIQAPYINRYTDYTGEVDKEYTYKINYIDYNYNETILSEAASASTRQFNDDELLDMVQEASFRYYWEGAEPNSGLALENIPGRKNMIATGASGFGLMAIIVAVERGFIPRSEAVERMLKITSFLENCDKFHGAVSHFMDGTTGKVEPFFGDKDNGGDLVETSFLFQGLLAVRQYFDKDNSEERKIRESITKLWEAVEWDWYDREKENKYLTWHWSPDKEWLIDHKLIGWNETMITYILAMASPTHPISPSMYYHGWASQKESAVQYRKDWGKTDDGTFYTNENFYHGIKLPVGVSNGGPLFFIHYSYLGLDPNRVTDKYTNYFENNRNIALINWRYCTENPMKYKGMGGAFWGLTASDGPWGYKAIEPNVESDNGTLAPTGALASFPYTPEQSLEALKNMYRNHGKYLWGEYGFKDAVNLQENWHARIYMGLNQAPVTIMIENYRSGLIWNLFMKNKEVSDVIMNLRNIDQ